MFDVCVVGSANLDLVVTTIRLPGPGETVIGTDYAEHAGGKGLNQVVAAARAGASCAFCATLGDDSAGDLLAGVLAGEGIDAARVRRAAGTPTGRALITVDGAAENTIVVVPGANRSSAATRPPPAKVVMTQLEIPVEIAGEAFTSAVRAGALTILNPAPAHAVPDELLRHTRVLVPNQHERAQLGGDDHLFALGVEVVITTMGGDGVEIVTRDSRTVVPAFAVDAVDTTGAGDAFCGALATGLAAGWPIGDAVRFGAAAGALATTKPGAVPSLPRRAEIERLLGG